MQSTQKILAGTVKQLTTFSQNKLLPTNMARQF